MLSDLQYGEVPFIEAKVEAEQMLSMAFELEPNLASAYATQGFLYLNGANQMEALSNFHRAIGNDPNNAYAHLMIAEIVAESGNFDASMEELELALTLDHRYPVIQYRLVINSLAKPDLEAVRRSVRPDQALLAEALIDFQLLCRLEVLAGHYEEAVGMLEAAFANRAIDWADLESPWYGPLRPRKDFKVLNQAVQDHMNRQREQLGWQPIES
ncbi:MAG: tetratricopeptide (TPR) repeat protein [Candidatus Azotimanducaceae bacterium]